MGKNNNFSLFALIFLTLFAFVLGFLKVNNELKNAHRINSNLQQQVNEQDAEIAKLVDTVKGKDEEIKENLKLIQYQQEEIQKLKEKVEKQAQVSRGESSNHRKLNMVATSYIALCSSGCTGFTATGLDVRNTPSKQVIAVDPDVIPLYSKVKVELSNGEMFYATALDTGGKIDGHRIDILMATYREAKNFGKQNVIVTVLREGKG